MRNKLLILLSLLVASVLVFQQGAFALSPEQKRLFDSGVYQFDHEVPGNGECGENSSISLSGNSNAAKAFNFLVGKGLANHQAAGVVGNLQAESQIMPNRKQGSGVQTFSSIDEVVPNQGFGIAQWTTAGRQQAWKRFAVEKNMDPLSLELQLMYLWHEMESDPDFYGLEHLTSAPDLAQATWIFLAFFERPGAVVDAGKAGDPVQPTSGGAKTTLDTRIALANRVTSGGGSPSVSNVASTTSSSSCSGGSAGATIRAGTFNIFHIDNTQSEQYWTARLRRSMNVITSNSLDVVGLQEARQGQQDKLMTPDFLGGKYGIYPKNTNGANFSPNPVIFDSARWELEEGKSKKFNIDYDGQMRDVAVQVKLKQKGCSSNCAEFYIINTHDPAGVRGGTDAIRSANSRIYVDLIKELDKEGLPILLTGDFNSPYKDQAHCIISGSGVIKDTWELFKNIKGCAEGRSEGTDIDRIYASPDSTVNRFWSAQKGETDGNGSDRHDTVMAELEIGGDADGLLSVDGYVFPLKASREAILNEEPAPWCASSTTNCHHDYNAADIFAPTGTEVVATRGGNVVGAKDTGKPGEYSEIGTRVTIMGDDGWLYYYAHMGANTLEVRSGQTVKAGALLGKVGTSANAAGTDPHLHIDRLPGAQHSSRPYCSGAACSGYPFDNIQALMSKIFNAGRGSVKI